MAGDDPYLSVVVTARNDDHGGDLLRRMQAFVNGWIGQCRQHDLSSELIVVDWNPPQDRPPLIEALRWPADTAPCQVRFLQVPPEIHRRYRHADSLPLYQMIAKNAGIRRARGRFILATNIDIIFSSELIRYLSQRRLEHGHMYRMDRYDVDNGVPLDGGDAQQEYCRTHLIRVNAREGTFDLSPDGRRTLSAHDIAEPESGISFGDGWYAVERIPGESAFRWVSNDAEVVVKLPADPPPLLVFVVEPGPGVVHGAFLLQVLGEDGNVLGETRVEGRSRLELQLSRAGGNVRSFRLHVVGGGAPILGDPRILNFRVYRCTWSDAAGAQSGPVLRSVPFGPLLRARGWLGRLSGIARAAAESDPGSPLNVPVPRGFRRLLAACAGRFSRPDRFAHMARAGQDIFETGSGVAPGAGWHDLEHHMGETFRWVSNDAELIVRAPEGGPQPLVIHVEPGPGMNWRPFQLMVRDESERIVASARVKKLQRLEISLPWKPRQSQVFSLHVKGGCLPAPDDPRILNFRVFWCGWASATAREPAPPEEARVIGRDAHQPLSAVQLHTNACGDFTLMSREHWFDLRGYPEFDTYSFHIDSVLCHAAHHGGASEEVLRDPMRIYHIEHGAGSGWTPEWQSKLFERLRAKGISWLDYRDLAMWAAQMRRLSSPMIFNRENWGLADFKLPETLPPR